ncbi:hypothetical protein [Macrococcus equipercicus]|uniref:Uncharacterized protein n=1 Tax=Macrococcus equipercicus TaxID=69967 RepID=A0A9Q9BR81_9STAP|nr:hypothetical protein [Macrococcus equipercicus]KAA1037580.1 hypothetical protein ERX35_009370 [Macrococcus equipercicus]UTH14089.1 hypothetical protein KFV11_01575 [Macrococcus equipercicus]
MANNWPPKHAGEHNPQGRTGNKDWDEPGLKGREDESFAKGVMNSANITETGMGFINKISSLLIYRDEGRKNK